MRKRIQSSIHAAGVDPDGTLPGLILLIIHAHHHTLVAKQRRRFPDQLRGPHCRRIYRHFVSADIQQHAEIFHTLHAAAHCQRHEALAGRRLDDVADLFPALAGGTDVEKHQFIHLLRVINLRRRHRIACIPKAAKIPAFDHPSVFQQQGWDDALLQHGPPSHSEKFSRIVRPFFWLFSG